ncbi:MAG: type III pantothenate kinase [Armatimonadota bacterium]
MLLVIDIGNTNIVLGIFEGDTLKHTWRIHSKENMTEDEYYVLIDGLFKEKNISKQNIKDIVMASVVPPLEYVFKKLAQKYFNIQPLMLGAGVKTGIDIKTDNPREVGADLIAGAAAAHNKYKKAAIIIDFGTATTLTAISSKGEFLGTSFAPGVLISLEALYRRASKLPKVELTPPKRAVGKNTTESMLSGIFYGTIGQIENIVKNMKKELNDRETIVIGTGGVIKLFEGKMDFIDHIEHELVLEGLNLIYRKNTILISAR